MELDIIGNDAKIVAQEDEWLALRELQELREQPELSGPPTTDSLTRCSCLRCGAERYVALLGTWSSCSVCLGREFIPTSLTDDLGLRFPRTRPFTAYHGWDDA